LNPDAVSNCLLVEPILPDECFGDNVGPFTDTIPDKFHLEHLPVKQQIELVQLLQTFDTVFNDNPGKTTHVLHKIQLRPGTKPIRLPSYRCNPEKALIVRKEIDEMKHLGVIEDSRGDRGEVGQKSAIAHASSSLSQYTFLTVKRTVFLYFKLLFSRINKNLHVLSTYLVIIA
jgi:hypothetical protein